MESEVQSVSKKPESATERGRRVKVARERAVRPVIQHQALLMQRLAGTIARDAASGISSQVAYVEFIDAGLDRRLADYVRDGMR